MFLKVRGHILQSEYFIIETICLQLTYLNLNYH